GDRDVADRSIVLPADVEADASLDPLRLRFRGVFGIDRLDDARQRDTVARPLLRRAEADEQHEREHDFHKPPVATLKGSPYIGTERVALHQRSAASASALIAAHSFISWL